MNTLSTLLLDFDGRNKNEAQLEADFKEIAKVALYGGHFHVENLEYSLDLRLVEVEFYFHSENPSESDIYNTAMYHRGAELDYFPVGSLYPHSTGVDITFERKDSYRASFLVRQYEFYDENKQWVLEKRPTYFREDLFGYTGCICGDGPRISWVDDIIEDDGAIMLDQGERINLSANNRPWRFTRRTKRA